VGFPSSNRLVLASASPRRQEILRNAGIPFIVEVTSVVEQPLPGENPKAMVERLAREKAFSAAERHRDAWVLGADTTVVVDQNILEKPRDSEDAARMLRLLARRTHEVITGVCLLGPVSARKRETGNSKLETVDVRSETTSVTMGPITEEEIQSYIATGEPRDKAGAYAIQGIASRWISRIEGDYFNVVGLPVSLLYRMLRERGAID
jgi:septum formation protein